MDRNFIDKDGNKGKTKNNKLMYFCINNNKLLKNITPFELRLKTCKVLNWMIYQYDKRYIKTKIRTYGNNVYTNFRGLNVSEDGV